MILMRIPLVSLSCLAALTCCSLLAQGLVLTSDPAGFDPAVGNAAVTVAVSGDLRARPAVTVTRSAVRASIHDGVATTTIEQVFRNDSGRDAEGFWLLPLPAGAVADGFKMTVGGKELAGQVLDASQARAVYEQIVRQKRDPGLLEYAGEGLLRARVYPIPANGEVLVEVRLRQVLQPQGGLYRWSWPMRAARLGDVVSASTLLQVDISSQAALSTVVAPYSTASVQRKGESEAKVTLEVKSSELQDFEVLFGLREAEFGLHLLAWRQEADDGYFALMLSPPRSLPEQQIPPRCVQLVVDTSGSMAGNKLLQAKAAARRFLQSLRPEDVFQLSSFSNDVVQLLEAPSLASPANLALAEQFIERMIASGGTNIGDALQRAFAAKLPEAREGGSQLAQIVFITDGEPTVGLTQPEEILRSIKVADRQQMRLFVFGVGNDVDVRLLDDLAIQHRGARSFVRPQENIETKVDDLCQKLSQPALTDVELRIDGLDSYQVHPTRLRDLFCGETLQVVGRYRNSGKQLVRLRGRQAGVVKEFVFPVEFPALAQQHAFVPTLWAQQHLATLLDAIRRHGRSPELYSEVKRLATTYGIVTPYTSNLILEEGQRLAGYYGRAKENAFDSNQWNSATGSAGSERLAGRGTGGPGGPSTGGPATPGLEQLGRSRTGADAVVESQVTAGDGYYLGGVVVRDSARKHGVDANVRRAAGRVFLLAGQDLLEQGLPADWRKQAVVIEPYSKAWFDLLQQAPGLREILALGERVAFRDGERVLYVRPPEPVPGGVDSGGR